MDTSSYKTGIETVRNHLIYHVKVYLQTRTKFGGVSEGNITGFFLIDPDDEIASHIISGIELVSLSPDGVCHCTGLDGRSLQYDLESLYTEDLLKLNAFLETTDFPNS